MRRLLACVVLVACGNAKDEPKQQAPVASRIEQVTPKLEIKAPPQDAVKTASGLIYKKLVENAAGTTPGRNDTVLVNYTSWKQATGETVFTSRTQGKPVTFSLAAAEPGFAEALPYMKTGETVMIWTPGSQVYELELVAVQPAPAVPPDLTAPATAKPTKRGTKYITVKPGTAEKARPFDRVTYDYTAWDVTGRMFDSTELRKRPVIGSPYKQPAVIEEILVLAGKGERVRVWLDAKQMALGPMPTDMPAGPLVYEIEVKEIERARGTPAPVPEDVAAPPARAKQTAKGVAYVVLAAGPGGPKPGPTDAVKIHYTGWTTDGRLVGSSLLDGKPERAVLNGVITGWTEGIMLMSPGDRMRMWIPEALAYKGVPGKPQGMVVYDIELLSIEPAGAQPAAAPPDVAAPPVDALKSPSGVAYKILRAKRGAAKPTAKDTVRVVFTGWTTDGKVVDSSKGQPYETKLTNVIDGWAETIPLLGVGEKARMWIPERLAYGGQEGAPAGMLVFDIELLEIVK